MSCLCPACDQEYSAMLPSCPFCDGRPRNAVNDLAVEHGLADQEMLAVRTMVLAALRGTFKNVDNGVGGGQCDFWIQHGDVEYKLVMAPHRSLKAAS